MSTIVYTPAGSRSLMVPSLGQMVLPAKVDTISEKLEDQYAALREKCIQHFGLEFCNSVLPHGMYGAMGRKRLSVPWWGWMILGLLLGRILRI